MYYAVLLIDWPFREPENPVRRATRNFGFDSELLESQDYRGQGERSFVTRDTLIFGVIRRTPVFYNIFSNVTHLLT
jgi:hypothetical protein